MNTEDYVSYPIAIALKKAGFDEPCQMYYTHEDAHDGAVWLTGDPRSPQDYNAPQEDDCPFARPICSAPTLWQAAKWLRNKCGLHVAVYPCMDSASDADGQVCDKWQFWFFNVMQVSTARFLVDGEGQFDSYEQALSEGIKSALELIKKGE